MVTMLIMAFSSAFLYREQPDSYTDSSGADISKFPVRAERGRDVRIPKRRASSVAL